MKVCIHRGAKQIGGSCVEIEYAGSRLILDLGLPLDAEQASPDLLAPIAGLRHRDESLAGVVISHPHQDHYGLAQLLPAGTPIFIGAAAERIIQAASLFIRGGCSLKATDHLRDRVAVQIGPFRVTPFLMDHSAYDSYALLVEAGSKALFYGGDLRGHGRKAALFHRLLAHGPRDVDALLLDGSSLGRLGADERFPTERQIERELTSVMMQTSRAVLVHASAQNIDRVVTIYRSTLQSNRDLIIDAYTAAVLEATGNANIPQANWKRVRLFVPQWQRRHIKEHRLFNLLDRHNKNRVFPEALPALAPRAVFLFRWSLARDLELSGCLQDACLVWSQWEGYLKHPAFADLVKWRERLGLRMHVLHTSVHACIADLQRLVAAMRPKCVVPIHSFHPDLYSELFSDVQCREDGERWAV